MFGGRRFAVANAWTKVGDELRPISVCALELPAPLPIFQVRPSQFPPFGFGRPVSADDPLFDTGFTVLAREAAAAQAVLTPEARRLIMARADWIFLAERLEFACLTMQPFESVEQVSTRIAEVHALLAAIPAAASPA
jgi:hypothetical protein